MKKSASNNFKAKVLRAWERSPKRVRLALLFLMLLLLIWMLYQLLFIHRDYYPDGHLRGAYRVDPLSKIIPSGWEGKGGTLPDGPFKEWYENGNLKMEGTRRPGVCTGKWRWYAENGRLVDAWEYDEAGRPMDGIRKAWYDNGAPKSEIEYSGGNLEGRSVYWAPDGRVMDDWTFHADVPNDGDRKIYNASHSLVQTFHYKDGLEDGVEREWYDDGGLKKVSAFSAGTLLSAVCYDTAGRKSSVVVWGTYFNSKLHSEQKWSNHLYFGDGNLDSHYIDLEPFARLGQRWTPDGKSSGADENDAFLELKALGVTETANSMPKPMVER